MTTSVKSKVSASALAAAIASYAFSLLDTKLGITLDPVISSLIVAALTTAATLAAGWLKKEHVIDEQTYESFVGSNSDNEVTAIAEQQIADQDIPDPEPKPEPAVQAGQPILDTAGSSTVSARILP